MAVFRCKKKKDMKKVLFINQEISPYVPTSAMGEIGRALPQITLDEGSEVRVFMPKWGIINERRNQLHEVLRLSGMNLIINDTDHQLIIKVATVPNSRLQVYFIDNYDFFTKRRTMAFDENDKEYKDNGERAIFYARGVLETVKKLRWTPNIIYCQGWMTNLVPYYVKKVFSEEPCFADCKIITGVFPNRLKGDLGKNFLDYVDHEEFHKDNFVKYNQKFDYTELAKMAMDYSDGIVIPDTELSSVLVKYARATGLPLLEMPPRDELLDEEDIDYNELAQQHKNFLEKFIED